MGVYTCTHWRLVYASSVCGPGPKFAKVLSCEINHSEFGTNYEWHNWSQKADSFTRTLPCTHSPCVNGTGYNTFATILKRKNHLDLTCKKGLLDRFFQISSKTLRMIAHKCGSEVVKCLSKFHSKDFYISLKLSYMKSEAKDVWCQGHSTDLHVTCLGML